MKVLLSAFLSCLIAFSACQQNSKSISGSGDSTTAGSDEKFREIPGWIGAFQDTLPCQDCLGALTRIQFFKDGHYHKSVTFLGKEPLLDHTFGLDGRWKFDPARNLIQLDSVAEKGNYFFRPIGDSLMVACFSDGQAIDAEKNLLRRVSSREFE